MTSRSKPPSSGLIATSLVAQRVKRLSTNVGDQGLIPGSGRSPGEGNGNPLQYSCLENPTDRGAWWATVCGAVKSWTRLSNFTFTFLLTYQTPNARPTRVISHSKCLQLFSILFTSLLSAALCGSHVWDLSSLTRDGTWAPCLGSSGS